MQKKLIALAVAGLASTGAFAQANVTVYGVADATFDVVRASNVKDGYDLGNTTRVSSNSSYIGCHGTPSFAFKNSYVPTPWIMCGPSKCSMVVRSPMPSLL